MFEYVPRRVAGETSRFVEWIWFARGRITTRGKQRTGQIGALDPGRSITLRSIQGGVTADYVYTCTPYGDGTRVSLVADCRMTGPVRLLSPMIRSAIRRADSGQLDAFAATFTPE